METAKQLATKVLQAMPDDCTWSKFDIDCMSISTLKCAF